jgi:ABC-type methionine transport system ATPase subunit
MAESPAAPCFVLDRVTQTRGDRTVLRELSVAFPAGELTALIGPSGSGKTSLLRLLNRLDDPDSGAIAFEGRPLRSYPVRELRRRVGFVFQAPTMFAGTVAENLRIAHRLAGPAAVALTDAQIAEMLATVELDAGYAAREARDLSGGEKQRVALARTLVTHPAVLLLDEPTAALDPEVADRLMQTLGRLRDRVGVTIVMVTHRLVEAKLAATHTVMLEAGRVVEAGATSRLFESPAHARTRAYLATAA